MRFQHQQISQTLLIDTVQITVSKIQVVVNQIQKETRFFRATIVFFIVALFISINMVQAQTIAFPGAEGFGRFATGGRGGKVIEVTNLNDAGTGSLRAAVLASGARTVVFRVSGTIKLASSLRIRNANITIAGQTAPGDGICIRDYTVRVEADNVIIRYLRFRLGDSTRVEDDAFSGNGSNSKIYRNVIIDHCSMSWAIDENSSFYDNGQYTVQYCYITESLYNSYHSKGKHGYGGIWGGWKVSFHHNLFAHNSSRNPRFNGSRYTLKPDSEIVDFRNNVIYDWGFNTIYGGEGGKHNIVANYYKYGPATNTSSIRYRIASPDDTTGYWYVSGNFVYGNDSITQDNWNGGIQGGNAIVQKNRRPLVPFPNDSIPTDTPEEAFEKVLQSGGASFPKRDTVDARIADEVRNGTATYGGSWTLGKGIIDSQNDVGGWPVLNSLPAPTDSDHDGMPDDWENNNSLNPADSTDGKIITGDGYSNLEHYINGLLVNSPNAVSESNNNIVSSFRIKQNYPNPFNPATTIEYSLQKRSYVRLEILDLNGKLVETLVNDTVNPGTYYAVFQGSSVSSGIYFYRVSAGKFTETRKMLLLK